MKTVNAIILAKSIDKKHFDLTYQTLSTLVNESRDNIKLNILLIENLSFRQYCNIYQDNISLDVIKNKEINFQLCLATSYESIVEQMELMPRNDFINVYTMYVPELFNYNKFLNIGLDFFDFFNLESDYTFILNNDLIFEYNSIKNAINLMELRKDIHSFSPFTKNWHCHNEFLNQKGIIEDNRRSYGLAGWCLFIRTEVFKKLGKFDEQFIYFYQDDDYRMNLLKNGFKHGLIRESEITHVLSQSFELIPELLKNLYTNDMRERFIKKWQS